MRWTDLEKGHPVTRTLVARALDGEKAGFPHARLDASRHDDRCRLRRRQPVHIHAMFNRWANSLLLHWRKRPHHTTTDFTSPMAADYDRRALSAILSRSFPS